MNDISAQSVPAKPRRFRNGLFLAGIAFVAGIGLTGWAVTSWQPVKDYVAPPVATLPPSAPAAPIAAMKAPVAAAPATDATTQIAMEARIASLEGRLATLSQSANGPLGNSRRAEGLLLAFAARRAIDRGLALGYLESELADYFGQNQPKAVAQVLASSRAPATLAMLTAELDRIAPSLSDPETDEGFFERVQREVAGLFVVRQAGTSPTAAKDRVTHARELVEIGRIDQAMAEIARVRNNQKAAGWMAMAKRYVEASNALDILEASALMAPKPEATPAPAPVVGPPDPERIPEPTSSTTSSI